MKMFRTFIVTWPSMAATIEGMGYEDEWRLVIQDDPSFRHWASDDNKEKHTIVGEVTSEQIRMNEKMYVRCKEVLIESIDEVAATNAASLIQSGTILAYPEISNAPKYSGAFEVIEKCNEYIHDPPFINWFTFQGKALFGCKVAFAAWAEPTLSYSIEKYRLSLELDSFTPDSASPRHGQVFLSQLPEYSYHVAAATAVLLAYSVIEELGLEIRSSNKKPRWNNKKTAEWNPDVKADVEERLNNRGVDLSDKVSWIFRGQQSPLEQSIIPQLGAHPEYVDGKIVRDREMEVIEALHYSSYIRNFVAAHKYSELVKYLGPYDVHNVQSLARRLILSALGLYKT